MRYLATFTWDEIANKMFYLKKIVRMWHAMALEKIIVTK